MADETIYDIFDIDKPDFPHTKEGLIGKRFDYLNHGYVELMDVMGDDGSVVEGARASFGKGAYDSDKKNKGLIRYLMEHSHTSPFELAVMKFRCRMPLFVRAQHIRHRTQSCNWESHRYKKCEPEYYVPPVSRFRKQDDFNKQSSGDRISEHVAQTCQEIYQDECQSCLDAYNKMLDAGVARETARGVLNSSFFTTGVWTLDLHNLLHYIGLRNDGHAQPEIHLMADMIENMVSIIFPFTYESWLEYKKESTDFSRAEMDFLKNLVSQDTIQKELRKVEGGHTSTTVKGSTRRYKDFLQKLEKQ